jgi:hypothetical protein
MAAALVDSEQICAFLLDFSKALKISHMDAFYTSCTIRAYSWTETRKHPQQ